MGAGGFQPTDLVTVWGGANDFFFANPTDYATPAANIGNVITTLASGGAKTILLLNLPDLGDLPETLANGADAIAAGHYFSNGFNNLLGTMAPTLELNLGILVDFVLLHQGCGGSQSQPQHEHDRG